MADEPISVLPPAISVNINDLLLISQATGNPSAPWVSKRVTINQVAGLSTLTTATAIEFIIKSNPGYAINTGLAGYLVAPFGGNILSATLLANITGSLTVNIWRCSNSQFDAGITHPVAADTICGGSPPAIVSGVIYNSPNVNGWNTAFSPGDVFAFNVDSASGSISQATLSLNVTKSTA
jgi:hypothetical protein